MLLLGIAVWVILAALGAAIVIGGNRKPTPMSRALREDLEVMRLEAMWDLPWGERSADR